MTPERWQRIKSLLESALEREPEERAAFLKEACADDPSLQSHVQSLILSHEQAAGFIESPALELMAESLDEGQSIVGSDLGPYRVTGLLGAGGMGEVYLAEDTRLGRKVALKVLLAHFTLEEERVRRFQQEARAASALNHPNIITIYEIGGMDARHFMATEFIEGDTLFKRLQAGRMKISDALDVAVQIASALCAAHQAGIVHRDIKPGNIMLRTDGIVKVLDFGLAMLTEQKSDDDLEAATLVKTKQGIVMGTAHYMSPEQARGQKMDARTDIFSLGGVLYQMVTGRVPFAGQTMTDVLASILMLDPPSLNQSAPEAPAELQRIVNNALRKDKEGRYQTTRELLTDLKRLKQQLEFEAESGRAGTPKLGGTSSPSRQMDQEIRFCTTADGVRIAYAMVGEGPPLVKAANWLNHLEFDWRSPVWRHLLEEFGRDHLLVRYDERGNGLSDWDVENFTFEAFVQDLATVVDTLGLDRFPILGISQGGPVAIAYAVRHPERVSHLILYGSYARGWAKRGAPEVIERFQAQKTLIKLGWGQDNPAFRQLWTTLYVPDATPEQWQWFNDLHQVSTSPDNAIRLLDELGKIDVVDLLAQVKVPTLVLHCRDEVVVPFEEGRMLAGLIPGARFVPLEGRNHLLLESEPAWAKFVAEVRRFLKTEPFEAKREWSHSTDSIDRKASARQTTMGAGSDQAIRTGEIAPAPVTSSAEYVVSEIKRHKTIVAAIVAIVVLCAAGYLLLKWGRVSKESANPLKNASFTQLTDQAGAEFFPSLSPDGKSLVYASRAAGNWDIYLQRVGGRNSTNLTKDSRADDTQPSFSPDGQRIAFRSDREGGGIYVMGATGESVTRLSDFGYSPAWSPDGERILVGTEKIPQPSTRPTKSQLWMINVKTNERQLISEGDALQPNFSPHRQRITYWSRPSRAGQRENIWTIPADGGEAVAVTNGSTTDLNPIWSPDGRYLYFSSNRGGSINVWRVAIDEKSGAALGEPEAVTTIGAATSALHLSFSRDGRRLAYAAQEDIRNLRKVAFDISTGKTSGDPTSITRGSMQLWFPDVSPDGEWLTACSRGQQRHVFMIRTDGSELRDLTDDDYRHDGWPRWSPNGKRIVFTSRRSGNYELWVINRDGSGLQQLTQASGAHYSPWSPDGRMIAYSIHTPKNDCVIVQPDRAWNEQKLEYLPPLSDSSLSFEGWSWSSDGRRLAGIKHLPSGNHSGIGIYDLESRNYTWFTDFGDWPLWFNDNRHLLFVSEGQILLFDTQTRKYQPVLTVTDQDVDIGSPALSPDNRTIYFTYVAAEADVWLMTLD
jgi:Tol biopolymer transport system component/serine/threonine protein kinase/pimeloyl-ACP methyl ester carboxylesterase